MPSIPIDVLREILEHVSKADLATLCRVNKIVSCHLVYLIPQLLHQRVGALTDVSPEILSQKCIAHTQVQYMYKYVR
jgi:F-box domain